MAMLRREPHPARRKTFYRACWCPVGGDWRVSEVRESERAARHDLDVLKYELGGGEGEILTGEAPNAGAAKRTLARGRSSVASRLCWGGKLRKTDFSVEVAALASDAELRRMLADERRAWSTDACLVEHLNHYRVRCPLGGEWTAENLVEFVEE